MGASEAMRAAVRVANIGHMSSQEQTSRVNAQLGGVVLECPDPRALAEFYSQLTGWPILFTDVDWCTVGATKEARPHLGFQLAPDYRPPRWPDPASSMQFHLDFMVGDLAAAEVAALKLGATKFDEQPSPADFVVFADPVGHPFCLCIH